MLTKLIPVTLMSVGLLLAQRQGGPGPRQGGNPEKRLQHMAIELDLTESQKAQLRPILEDEATKLRALRDEANLTRGQRIDKMDAIVKDARERMSPILTEEQRAKVAEMRKEMRDQARSRRHASPQQPQ